MKPKHAILIVVAISLGLSACHSMSTRRSASNASNSKNTSSAPDTFTLSEFTITAPKTPIHAGAVKITADNVGSEKHELVIVAASGPLPTKSDGSVDEDKIPETDKRGETGDVPARSRKSTTFDLSPGTYVAFCNLVDTMGGRMMNGSSGMTHGHVHYALGMHVEFTVP